MSTTLSLPSRRTPSRRTQVLAGASALVAAVSVAVTLALSGGGGDRTVSQPSAGPATASPDRATQYRNDTALGRQPERSGGPSAAERFHHFR
jgi:hypothetical protein